ncbi:tetraspanin-16 [Peromyscus californicus insignis]|uniref:tetraspanin-16 n=1 Tax=Peromyscus californicus insignis TaxID=564181 RepID=UPI0022A78DCC|nr:tetraspanin-16 [Peromyscus californicus insignis]
MSGCFLMFLHHYQLGVSGMVLTGLVLGVMYGEASLTKVLGMSSAYLFHFGYLSLGMRRITRCFLLLVIIVILEVVMASVVLVFFPLGPRDRKATLVTTGHTYPRGCCKSIGTANCDGYNVSSDVIYQELLCADPEEARSDKPHLNDAVLFLATADSLAPADKD